MSERDKEIYERNIAISWWLSENKSALIGFTVVLAVVGLLAWSGSKINRRVAPVRSFYGLATVSSAVMLREKHEFGKDRRLRIADSKTMFNITSAMQAIPTDEKVCGNLDSMVIETSNGNVRIAFCPHCLGLESRNGIAKYRMTPKFLKALQDAVKDDPQQWDFKGWAIPSR